MGDRTGIEWTDATWNPVRGCSRVSAGCVHCYAERVAARFSGEGQSYAGLVHPRTRGWNGQIMLVPEALEQPLRWMRPRRVFVNSMSDLFHEGVPDEFIDRVFAIMALAPRHTFQVLTKRPERMHCYLSHPTRAVEIGLSALQMCCDEMASNPRSTLGKGVKLKATDINPGAVNPWPLPNVWLGVSVEDQASADERIPLLLQTPAAVRFLSCEPLLGRVDLCEHLGMWWNQTMRCFEGSSDRINASHFMGQQRIGWVIVGGESGPGARPMHPDWSRTLRDQCAAAGVPFFFKQWGEWAPDEGFTHMPRSDAAMHEWIGSDGQTVVDHSWRYGKKKTGRLLDGVEHNGFPRELEHLS